MKSEGVSEGVKKGDSNVVSEGGSEGVSNGGSGSGSEGVCSEVSEGVSEGVSEMLFQPPTTHTPLTFTTAISKSPKHTKYASEGVSKALFQSSSPLTHTTPRTPHTLTHTPTATTTTTTQSSPFPFSDEDDSLQPTRDIPLIYSNLVQFEGCTRTQHKAAAQMIRDNPGAYQASTTCASRLTLSETLYIAQILEMWAHMSKEHRDLFVEMVVIESSIARIDNIRNCDMTDARTILKQDVEYYDLSTEELDRRIAYLRSQSTDDIRALLSTSVKYQAYYMPYKPLLSEIDKLTCGYSFALFIITLLSSIGWISFRIFCATYLRR